MQVTFWLSMKQLKVKYRLQLGWVVGSVKVFYSNINEKYASLLTDYQVVCNDGKYSFDLLKKSR